MADNNSQLEAVLKEHQTLVVAGANWGDEGKGKIIDKVLSFYDIAARFSGGANAGHTIFTPSGQKLVSHLIPCGLAQNKICVLSRGEFFNVELFLKEREEAKNILGTTLPAIYIDQQAPLWTPYHRLFEAYIESRRGENKIGTTNKGIGPLEGLYKLRLAPVVGYLFQKELLLTSLTSLYKVLAPCFETEEFKNFIGEKIPTAKEVAENLIGQAKELESLVCDTAFLMDENLRSGKRILFEGAQATGLDAWWGTYPYVSSGNSVASGAALGSGLPSQVFGATILVAKALPTRVGFGPMPSEMWDRQAAMDFAKNNPELYTAGEKRTNFLAEKLQQINSGQATPAEMSQYFQVLGDERGATTGRGRSVGFLDIPWLLYAIRINGPKWLALTRFDMLSGLKSIPVVVGYKFNGQILPAGKIPPPWQLQQVEIIKEEWPGFEENISGLSSAKDLPKSATQFLEKLEKHLKVPILLVGTGPGREAIVTRG